MEIGPIKTRLPEIKFPQGSSEVLPALPIRALALANSGSGKTNMISTLITDSRFYRGKFQKLYWISPTALIDDALQPIRDYVAEELDQDQSSDPTFHDHIDVPFLTRVIERSRRVMEYIKSKKPRPKHAWNVMIVLDDVADTNNAAAIRLVNQLAIKGRHWGLSFILSSQKLRLPLVTQAVRVNITALFVWRLRNQSDLWDGIIWEYSALVSKEKLLAAYRASVDKPFGFLFIRLDAKSIDHMFYAGFGTRFVMSDKDEAQTAREASHKKARGSHDKRLEEGEDL